MEPISDALVRVSQDELGLKVDIMTKFIPMGAWDHIYPDSAYDETMPTHYINLPHLIFSNEFELDRINPPVGSSTAQHSDWRWVSRDEADTDISIHPYIIPYLEFARSQAILRSK